MNAGNSVERQYMNVLKKIRKTCSHLDRSTLEFCLWMGGTWYGLCLGCGKPVDPGEGTWAGVHRSTQGLRG